MTTPNPERMTPEELRREFASLHTEIAELHELLVNGHSPAPHAEDEGVEKTWPTRSMSAVKIMRTNYQDKWFYKLLTPMYMQRGIAVWPEALEALEIDVEKLEWEKGVHTFPKPIQVDVLMKPYIRKNGPKAGQEDYTPHKVVGKTA